MPYHGSPRVVIFVGMRGRAAMLYDGKPVDSVFVAQPLATKDWVRIAAYFDLPASATRWSKKK